MMTAGGRETYIIPGTIDLYDIDQRDSYTGLMRKLTWLLRDRKMPNIPPAHPD